jgi:hypothetical protein
MRSNSKGTGAKSSGLKRLEFEMALELGLPGETLAEGVRRAAEATGGELVFVLPAPDGRARAVVRFVEDRRTVFVEVRPDENGVQHVVADEDIDGAVLGFARASIDVMERLRADTKVVAPLAAAN